jgi:hypothetical protein
MSDKNFLSWVGFKADNDRPAASSENALERIRELESQIADLRSRRDITALSKEEFEILATETAMTIIKSAQQRERQASILAQKVIADSTRNAKETKESAEAKARQILNAAESRGRKYIDAAESEAAAIKEASETQVSELLATKQREANLLSQSAKREADRMIADAVQDISDYREWLTSAITEAEKLYKVQTQSLLAAEQAISASRAKLGGAFEKLAGLQNDIDTNVGPNNRPTSNTFVRSLDTSPVEDKSVTTAQDISNLPLVPHKIIDSKPAPVRPRAVNSSKSGSKRVPSKRK